VYKSYFANVFQAVITFKQERFVCNFCRTLATRVVSTFPIRAFNQLKMLSLIVIY